MKSGTKKLGSVSDLMSGLMMVFLFIAIAYMVQTEDDKIELIEKTKSAEDQEKLALKLKDEAEKQRQEAERLKEEAEKQKELVQNLLKKSELRSKAIKKITATFKGLEDKLYEELKEEFRDDLPKWKAELFEDSTIRFNEPKVLFKTGDAALQDKFIDILKDFFPRYEEILSSEKFRDEIEEIRVEGHTSSEWQNAKDRKVRYTGNVKLSQARALSVIEYSMSLIKEKEKEDWLSKKIRANGLGFAKLILKDGIEGKEEDKEKSRRVEFRVMTKTRDKIVKIIQELEDEDN